MTQHEHTIDVDVPVATAFERWLRCETFPDFMSHVESVEVREDGTLRWTAKIAGVARVWDARTTEVRPDELIAWASVDGAPNIGRVEFTELTAGRCRVTLAVHYEPASLVERAGSALGLIDQAAEADLRKFKEIVEEEYISGVAYADRTGLAPDIGALASSSPDARVSAGAYDAPGTVPAQSGSEDVNLRTDATRVPTFAAGRVT